MSDEGRADGFAPASILRFPEPGIERGPVRMKRLRPPNVSLTALIFCLLGTAVFLATKAFAFLASGDPPFGYYYDLGINGLATDYIAHAIGSWNDFTDNIGWGSWGDLPNFLFNPSLSYFVLVPIEKLLHNVWLSVKTVQTLEEIVAFGGAAYLYATIVRRDIWCCVAGLLYAILPATALQIRGNLDIGWAYALLPLAIALELSLVRRLGLSALPTCGVLSSFAAFCFAPEYVILSSVPMYLVAVAAALPRFTWRGAGFALFGFAALFGLAMFFILPTLGGEHLFTDPAARTASLAEGSEIGTFSESWSALLVLMPQEFLISSFRQFNAQADLGFLWVVTLALWTLAAFAATRALRNRDGGLRRRVLLINIALLAFAMGTSLPAGGALWSVVRTVPGLSFVRTPDRFLIVPALFVILGATESLAMLADSRRAVARAFAVTVVAIAIGLFLNVDFAQHWLTTESDVAYREPDLGPVNDAVAKAGGRTVSYAYLRDGSQFFNSYYGAPTPTLRFHWDPTAHYYDDGLGGFGIFKRSDVRTAIASPNWMADSATLPSTARIDGTFPGKPIFSTPGGLLVKRIAARPILSAGRASCVIGGPGLLDWATSINELTGLTFVRSPAACHGRTYLDFDPGTALRSGPSVLGTWDSDALLPAAPSLHDADYPFLIGRMFINDSWYRNSVDGDDTASASGAKLILKPTEIPIDLPAFPSSTKVTILVRLASRSSTTLSLRGARGDTIVPVSSGIGMRWYALPLRNAGGQGRVTLAFGALRFSQNVANDWQGVALDRVVAVRNSQDTAEPTASTDAVLFSAKRFRSDASRTPSASLGDSDVSDDFKLVESKRVIAEDAAGERRQVAEGRGVLHYRWEGPAGTYVIAAAGGTTGSQAELELSSHAHAAVALMSSDTVPTGRVVLRGRLRPGQLARIVLTDMDPRPGSSTFLTSVRTMRVGDVSGEVSPEGAERFIVPFEDFLRASSGALSPTNVEFADGGVTGEPDSSVVYRFSGKVGGNAARLRVRAAGDGRAVVRLTCGKLAVEKSIAAGIYDISLSGTNLRLCRVAVRWVSKRLLIGGLQFDLFGEPSPKVSAAVWLPRGSYAVRMYRPAIEERAVTISLDGMPAASRLTVRRSGFHRIVLRDVKNEDRLLAFIPNTQRTFSIPNAVQLSTYRWDLALAAQATLEVAWYPDGNWRLQSDSAPQTFASSVRCDLINTCFTDVPPGRYHLYHVWPSQLRLGLGVSALTLLVSAGVLALATVIRRRETLATARSGNVSNLIRRVGRVR